MHGSERALQWVSSQAPSFDAVVVGGDVSKGGPGSYTEEFLKAAGTSPGPTLFVHGNWDPPSMEVPPRVTVLHGKTARVGGYVFGGLGGSGPTPFRSPFEMKDDEARGVLAGMGRVDVLVSHSPPARTRCDRARGGHIGSVPVREYVEREKPHLVLSGHVHESRGVDSLGGTTIVNPGPLFDGGYAEVSLDGIVNVELKAGWGAES